jgi:NADPH:quinone reductase-like Zn-dependent oxidoreductase
MKAAVIREFGPPYVFHIEDMPTPEIKEDQVLVKVHASSVNPIDWKTRKGNLRFILGSAFPIILGYDVSGEVMEIGKRVKKFKKGDLVYSRLDRKFGGAYAEYAVGSESTFALKPEKLSHEEAASIPLAALTALQGLRDLGKMKEGDKVLLIGAASGVGHFAVQIVNILGGESWAVSSLRHQKLVEILKPAHFIDYTRENYKQIDEQFDIVFDIVGTETFLTCRHLLKSKGTYITTLPRPKILIHRAITMFVTQKKVKTFLMKPYGADLELLNSWIEEGKFHAHIDRVFPLEKIADAHQYSEEGHAEGKIVIKITKE